MCPSLLPIVDLDTDFLICPKSHLKAVLLEDVYDWEEFFFRRKYLRGYHYRPGMMLVNRQGDRKSLNHRKGKRVFIHILSLYPDMIWINMNIDLLLIKPHDGIKAREKRKGEGETQEANIRPKQHLMLLPIQSIHKIPSKTGMELGNSQRC